MKNLFLQFLLILFGVVILCQPTLANQGAEEGAREALKHYVIKEGVEYTIDKILAESARDAAMNGALTPGSTVVGVYSLVVALDSLKDAKTDRQRFYALSNVTGSIMSLAGSPYAWAVNTAVMLETIRYMTLNSMLARYEAKIARVNTELFLLKTSIIEAQSEVFFDYFDKISRYIQERNTNISFFEKECVSNEELLTVLHAETCIQYLQRITANHRLYIHSLKRLLSLKANDFSLDQILEKSDIKRDDFIEDLKRSEAHLDSLEKQQSEWTSAYSSFIFESIVKESEDRAFQFMESTLLFNCRRFARNLLSASASLLLNPDVNSQYLNAQNLIREIKIFLLQEACMKVDGFDLNLVRDLEYYQANLKKRFEVSQ